MSFKEHVGEQGTLVPRIATGFGAGIGRRGSLCGALTGSVMVLGMKFGRTGPEDKASRDKVYGLGSRFWDLFEREFGNCACYNLIQCRLDDEEERKRWLASGGMEKCRSIVERTAGLLWELMEEGR